MAIDLRGRWLGNRGCLHVGRDIVRPFRGRRWIVCALEFRGWRAPMWEPNRWTPLFFHDEAVAFAAGHRPCALCRHAAYRHYLGLAGAAGADELDARLHAERLAGPHSMPWSAVPMGAFVLNHAQPHLVRDDRVMPWTTSGYGAAAERPHRGDVAVLTPPTSCAVLAGGYPIDVAAS